MPGAYPLDLYRGDSAAWDVTCWQDAAKTIPADLTGAVAKSEIRNTSGGTNILTLTCTITGSVVHVKLPATLWATWPAALTTAVWDLQLTYTATGAVVTILAGAVKVTPDVTDSTAGAGRRLNEVRAG